MDIACLCPLPVGVVRWRSPGRSLTVVVKMSLSLAGPEVALADPQEPLSLERPLERGGPDDLYSPSDFAPRKARCDVLLVGSARADPPASIIQARVSFGELDRRFIALAGASSPSIPLREPYLRGGTDPASPSITVGPRRSRSSAAALLGANGAPAHPLEADFDFSAFNVAPPEQQVSVLRSGGVLALDGLLPGRPIARLDMPSDRPRVYCQRLDAPRDRGARAPLREILLRCDTLWIDVDRALCSLTWRGELAIPEGASEPPLLVVTLAPFGLGESLEDIESRVDRDPGNSQKISNNSEDLTTLTVGPTRLVGPSGPVLPFHSPPPPPPKR